MITYTQGNMLEADAEALVNTVNTVGVMGKGIALMFKERFPQNFKLYEQACKVHAIETGRMFVTEVNEFDGPRWIINFPTKQHWRAPSKMEWIREGLHDLRSVLVDNQIKSIAIPPLGAGNGKLEWMDVRREIESALSDLSGIQIIVYEPTKQYQNVAKRAGVDRLTPARALIAELVRRYWVLGMECSLLEIQKLAWFLERVVEKIAPDNPLKLQFVAHKYGPYANRLDHLLNNLDGSYLHCEKRISDADPFDVIWFDDAKNDLLQAYLKGADVRPYLVALENAAKLIDGFESPFGMELLATVDWLIAKEHCDATLENVRAALKKWPGGEASAERKNRIFDDKSIQIALDRLTNYREAIC